MSRRDTNGFVYRGRFIGTYADGEIADELWSCPRCHGLVAEPDRTAHDEWHKQTELIG